MLLLLLLDDLSHNEDALTADVCSRERDDNDFGGVVLGGCGPKERDCVLEEEWRISNATAVAVAARSGLAMFGVVCLLLK